MRTSKLTRVLNLRCGILFIVFGSSIFLSNAQELKYKANFTLNFIKQIGWTELQRQGDFVIGVVGKEALSNELRAQTAGKKFGFQDIVVKDFSKANKITPCQVLYVGKDAMFELLSEYIIRNCGGKGFLLITETPNAFEKGSIVNLFVIDDAVKFEFSEGNAKSFELIYNSRLAQMATSLDGR